MKRARIIPVLLLKGNGLYKTTKFKKPIYVGDPINAVKIFSEKQVDEIVILDIEASKCSTSPNTALLEKIASECFIPLTYGGGIRSVQEMALLYGLGIEKLSLNSCLFKKEDMIKEAVSTFGSQSIVASIDLRKNIMGYAAYTHSGTKRVRMSFDKVIHYLNSLGIGEILLNSINRDGTLQGYDLKLIQDIANQTSVPITACGGCKSLESLLEALINGASAAAAGSIFTFKGSKNSVLINYPSQSTLNSVIFSAL